MSKRVEFVVEFVVPPNSKPEELVGKAVNMIVNGVIASGTVRRVRRSDSELGKDNRK